MSATLPDAADPAAGARIADMISPEAYRALAELEEKHLKDSSPPENSDGGKSDSSMIEVKVGKTDYYKGTHRIACLILDDRLTCTNPNCMRRRLSKIQTQRGSVDVISAGSLSECEHCGWNKEVVEQRLKIIRSGGLSERINTEEHTRCRYLSLPSRRLETPDPEDSSGPAA